MDLQDGLYLLSTALVSAGAWRAWGDGYGLLCLGLMLIGWPLMAMFLAQQKPGDSEK